MLSNYRSLYLPALLLTLIGATGCPTQPGFEEPKSWNESRQLIKAATAPLYDDYKAAHASLNAIISQAAQPFITQIGTRNPCADAVKSWPELSKKVEEALKEVVRARGRHLAHDQVASFVASSLLTASIHDNRAQIESRIEATGLDQVLTQAEASLNATAEMILSVSSNGDLYDGNFGSDPQGPALLNFVANLSQKDSDALHAGLDAKGLEYLTDAIGVAAGIASSQSAQSANQSAIDNIRRRLEEAHKDEKTCGDSLGNFEIQDLLNQYNQSETLASSVLKKQDDTNSAVIGKI